MVRIIGTANEFYRLRVARMDASEAPDFEWRDDVLWRSAPAQEIEESVLYRVEAVELADDDTVHPLATFATSAEAYEYLTEVSIELAELTKSGFEAAYFADAPAGPDAR